MAILEKEVLVTCGNSMDNYYEDLGYKIPRYKNNQGKMKVKRGTKILVKVKDLPKNSGAVKLTKICDECGKKTITKQSYQAIMVQRENGDGKDRCRSCGNLYAKNLLRENVPYERSLEYFAKNNNMEYLLEEYSDKNIYACNNIFKASNEFYLWNCPKCKSEYSMKASDRTKNYCCPYCVGRQVNHTNCLSTIFPEVSLLLTDHKIGLEVTSFSAKKVSFTCPDCGFIQNKSISNVVKQGFSCSRCSDGIKYPEKFVIGLLDQMKIEYQKEKIFHWSLGKRYDFYIPSKKLIIETHGGQHFNENGFDKLGGRTLSEEKENDEYKKQLAKMNGISSYIVLDCRESNWEYIKNSVIDSDLNKVYNLNGIDFLEIHKFACNSNLVKMISKLWNEGITNTYKIAVIVKLDRTSVSKYLKQGTELGWCNYDAKKVMKDVYDNIDNKYKEIKVVQLSRSGEYIGTWNSSAEAGRELGLSKSNITAICKGNPKYKLSGGYKWMYKEDYDKQNNLVNY